MTEVEATTYSYMHFGVGISHAQFHYANPNRQKKLTGCQSMSCQLYGQQMLKWLTIDHCVLVARV